MCNSDEVSRVDDGDVMYIMRCEGVVVLMMN